MVSITPTSPPQSSLYLYSTSILPVVQARSTETFSLFLVVARQSIRKASPLTFKTYPSSVPSHQLYSVIPLQGSVIPCWGYSSCFLLVPKFLLLPNGNPFPYLMATPNHTAVQKLEESFKKLHHIMVYLAQNFPMASHFSQSKTSPYNGFQM